MLSESELLAQFAGVKKTGNGWTARCPAHKDKVASLSISPGTDQPWVLMCFGGCSPSSVMEAAGIKPADLCRETTTTTAPPETGLTLDVYAANLKLPIEFLKGLGVSQGEYQRLPAVKIATYDPKGEELGTQIRISMSGQRFRWSRGAKAQPFGVDRLDAARTAGTITIVEGASDQQVLSYYNVPAYGLPGAGGWKEERDADRLDGIPTIYVVAEPDDGGKNLLAKLATSRLADQIKVITLDPQPDPRALHISDPAGFRAAWGAALANAQPLAALVAQQTSAELDRLAVATHDLAHAPRILDLFADALEQSGVANEGQTGSLLYLAITSRWFEHPTSVVLKGPSSGGKSFVLDRVLAFFPKDAYYALSGMSEHALIYDEEPVVHRMIVLYEQGNLGDSASYFIRTLLSEGHLAYTTVEKDGGGKLVARTIVRDGPTGLLLTTTAPQLHPENETRLLSITIRDTPEQTAAILTALAVERPPFDHTQWQDLQTWIGMNPALVTIPFALALANLVPPISVRLRRDFKTLLELVGAHALLHQASRDRDDQRRIIATIEDYTVVHGLAAGLLAEGVDQTISATVRDTVEAVDELTTVMKNDKDGASNADVATHLKIDRAAASRRLRVAAKHGYIRNLENRTSGYPARYRIDSEMPGDAPLLPEPAELAAVMEGLTRAAVLTTQHQHFGADKHGPN